MTSPRAPRIESLKLEGLADTAAPSAVELSTALDERSVPDIAAAARAIAELQEILAPLSGLTARTVRSSLDDATPTRVN